MYSVIDSVKNIPQVKTYIDVVDVIVNGYLRVGGGIELGPYIYLYGYNTVEGNRFRAGFRTSGEFSKNWILKGYVAYGTRDQMFKYSGQVERFLSRKYWTKVGVQYKKDLEGLGMQDEFFSDNTLLNASSQLGLVTRMNLVELWRVWAESDLFRGYNQRVYFMTKNFTPVGRNVDFVYYPDPVNNPDNYKRSFHTTELAIEGRIGTKDAYIVKDNRRVRLQEVRAPIVTPLYALGLKGVLGGDFAYHKFSLNIHQMMKLGWVGRGEYSVTGTRLFSNDYLPYPLMDIQLGNETVVRSDNAFNLMNFFEFIGDRSLTAFYTHHFDGLLFNRIPLLRNLKWREVAGAKAAWVDMSRKQRSYYERLESLKGDYPEVRSVLGQVQFARGHEPYVEVFYGIENIFKILRIDAIHRVTYQDRTRLRFFVKGSLYFAF